MSIFSIKGSLDSTKSKICSKRMQNNFLWCDITSFNLSSFLFPPAISALPWGLWPPEGYMWLYLGYIAMVLCASVTSTNRNRHAHWTRPLWLAEYRNYANVVRWKVYLLWGLRICQLFGVVQHGCELLLSGNFLSELSFGALVSCDRQVIVWDSSCDCLIAIDLYRQYLPSAQID